MTADVRARCRQGVRLLREMLDRCFTEDALDQFCFENFPAAQGEVGQGGDKQDKLQSLIEYCYCDGQIDALVLAVRDVCPGYYFSYKTRLDRALPLPDGCFPCAERSHALDEPSLPLGLALVESSGRAPPPGTNVYAWLRVDDEDFEIIDDRDVQPVPWTNAGPDLVTFHLQPRSVGHYQTVRIELYHESNYLGAVERDIKARSASEPGEPQPIRVTITLYPELTPPDLLIRFHRGDVHDGQVRFHYRVSSPLPELRLAPLEHMGSVALEDPATVLAPVLEDLDGWAKRDTPDKEDLDARLESLGANLFARLMGGTKMAKLYWRLPRRCKTVQIISDVAGIPWEMIRPTDPVMGTAEAWARQFQLTRWHKEAGAAPPGFALDGVKLFVGEFTPPLPGAEPEARALETLLGPRCGRVRPAQLRELLKAGGFGALHIISHGHGKPENADESYVRVGGGEPNLPASALADCNWMATRPLLFVNACNVGRVGIGLTGLGGWATTALTQAQAGAFMGALWQATDGTAGIFAETFYRWLLDGATVGAAILKARQSIESRPDPTWLCYAVYAHPNARVL